jgi:regulator of cell morphogenesis and NO signaling
MESMQTIDGTMTINETIQRHPETVAVFDRFGLDSCCGGSLAIAEAAKKHGLEPADVLSKLNAEVDGG